MIDQLTIERIGLIHPIIRGELTNYYIELSSMLSKNCMLRFSHTYRSPEEQDILYKKRPKVTNAKGWQSIHNYGLAFDIVLLYDKNKDGKYETPSWTIDDNWLTVVKYFKSKGYEWGGDWKKLKDAPHFQKAFGLTWQHMKDMIDTKQYTVLNGIKYINIHNLN